MEKITCDRCIWVDKFNPRKDEIERGLILGCKKPGWEGYTKNEEPSCGWCFFYEKEK